MQTDIVKIKHSLNKLWTESKKLKGADPVCQYLRSRGISIVPDNVRFCHNCYYADDKKRYPAMVSMVHNADGEPVSVHRTYLAEVPKRKKLMPGKSGLRGAAIRLMEIKLDTLGISEGIETALSAAQLYGVPVWAAISSGGLESWEPPEDIRKIIIFGDNDSNYVGESAAYNLAKRLCRDRIISVEIPEIVGDFNDVLQGVNEILKNEKTTIYPE